MPGYGELVRTIYWPFLQTRTVIHVPIYKFEVLAKNPQSQHTKRYLESTTLLDGEDENDVGTLIEGLIDLVLILWRGRPNALGLGQRNVFKVVRLHEEESGVAENVLRRKQTIWRKINHICSERKSFNYDGTWLSFALFSGVLLLNR